MKTERRTHKLLDSIFVFFLLLSFAIFLILGVFIVTLRYKEYADKIQSTYRMRLDEQKNLIKQKIDDIEELALFQKEQSNLPGLSQKNLLPYISAIRFGRNGNGYIYVIRKSTGLVLMHPVSPDTVGRDVRNIRDVDIAGRIGGEEFAVLMPATGKESAVIVAERIRNELAHRVFEYEGKTFQVTISIGLASIPPEKLSSSAELLKIADTFLYRAKETGTNKVCL